MNRGRPRRLAKDTIKSVLKSFDVGVTRYATLEHLRSMESANIDLEFLRTLYPADASPDAFKYLHKSLHYMPKSRSQYRQDLFVLNQLGYMTDGFFVEFGATDGIGLSNTYLLEKEFSWRGILAEPARGWQQALARNRAAFIETNCVWTDTGSKLIFNEVEHAGLSTIKSFSNADLYSKARENGTEYEVQTISLSDLLDKYQAPDVVDFMSVDTEGSEYEILKAFDFSTRQFRVIVCEHNYTPMREAIYGLLTSNGYQRVFPSISNTDDWYVLK